MSADNKTPHNRLTGIYAEFQDIIDGDSLLKADFDTLKTCLSGAKPDIGPGPVTAEICQRIIGHLVSEVEECADDEQRNQDESPMWAANAEPGQAQRYFDLKDALDRFRLIYIK